MRASSVLLAAVVAYGSPACSASKPTDGPTAVTAAATAEGIRFTNRTDRPIYYTAFEREYAARVMFAPCTDPALCPSIAPRGEAVIPFAMIGGYEPGKREAMVYWWHLAPANTEGRLVEEMHSEVVRLVPGM